MAPEAGQPEKPAALNRGPRLRPGKRTAGPCEGRLPAGPCRRPSPLRRKAGRKATAGPPQWKRGKGGDAGAKDGGRPPGKGGSPSGIPLPWKQAAGCPADKQPQPVPARKRQRRREVFSCSSPFFPPSAHWSPSPLKARPYRLRKARPSRRRSSTGRAAKPAPRPANTTGAARTVTWASVTNASWRSTASQTSSPASSPCGRACR